MKALPDVTIPTREELRALAVGFQRSRVLLTAFELDLFTALGGHRLAGKSWADQGKKTGHGFQRFPDHWQETLNQILS